MAQGNQKLSKNNKNAAKKSNSAKTKKQVLNAIKVKKGNPLKVPSTHFRKEVLEERELTKAISKSVEQKVAAKLIQGGGKLGLKDIMQKGKELSRDLRRKQVKRKKSRMEEKLLELKQLAERDGNV